MFIERQGKGAKARAERGLESQSATVGDDLLISLTGLNHRSATVDLRERFAIAPTELGKWLGAVAENIALSEAVVVSTCNRTEVIAVCEHDQRNQVAAHIEQVFEEISGISHKQFSSKLYHLSNQQAVEHVFRVASGLDSLVIGEPQVLGQLKDAYAAAKDFGSTKATLNRLLQFAFAVAKSVRTRTKIGQNAVSVCSAAKELAERIFGDLEGSSVMLIGAGEMGALTLRHMRAAGAENFYIVNKTLSRAVELAETVAGAALDLRGLEQCLDQADIVIGAATLPPGSNQLISSTMVENSLRQRSRNPQFFIDLGVPRNFDSAIGDLEDAFLFNIDDLESVVTENMDARVEELKYAEIIVAQEVERFENWRASRVFDSTIRDVREKFTEYQQHEVEKTIRRLRREGFSDQQCQLLQSALQDLSSALVAKSLHRPIAVLKGTELSESGLSGIGTGIDRSAAVFRRFFLEEDLGPGPERRPKRG